MYSNHGKLMKDLPQMQSTINEFENHITRSISYCVHHTNEHVVLLQPGALRSPLGTVPQKAHRDFTSKTYKEKFPGQVFIGFMPITCDGMFLQVWNGPGEAK